MASQRELVEQVFEAAHALKPPERNAFLDKTCRNDPELREVVERLLAADSRASSSLQHRPLDIPNEAMVTIPMAETASRLDGNRISPNQTPAGRLELGQILIDRFVVIRFIAKGGMGEVYEVEDRFLQGVHVALKTILPQMAGDRSLQNRFEREVLLAQTVTHENLCPIYAIFHSEQPPPSFLFLTMKLLPGITLATRLHAAIPISIDEALIILKQMAAGLAAIHAAGIIHRDIKPNNIVLDGIGRDIRLWITDFGLARAYETGTTFSGGVAGTPDYIAPELFKGHPPTQASDLFAFGIVLHEIFTGQKPTVAQQSASVVVNPRLNSNKIPSFCTRLVTECLSYDPKRRCQAFERALNVLDPKPAYSRSPYRRTGLWTRRRFAATSAATACAIAAGTWWKRDEFDNLLHPLPRKRFVALLNWPKTSDIQLTPILTGVLDAIRSEIARVEVFDRDLFVILPEEVSQEVTSATRLKEISDPLGANLVLAAAGQPSPGHFKLVLRLLNPIAGQPIRQRKLSCALAEITSLPGKAVLAAASLLSLGHYLQGSEQSDPGTQSAAAYTAFQAAETLMKHPNDSGLSAAIDKYKEAAELDPRYAIAHANLAIAFGRLYALHHDPAALDLARRNCEVALALAPGIVDGHLAFASVLEQTGNEQGALSEISKALTVDPGNARTLVWQAQIYTRLDRWGDAEQTFRRVLKERPNYWLAYNELGVVLNRQGKYQEAIKAFRNACLAAPGSSLAFNNVGAIYLQIGEFPSATENFKKSFALKPNGMAASNTSLALRSEGKDSEALPFALKAVELDPTNDSNWLELGDCYSSLRKHRREAKGAYLRAAIEAEQHLQTNPADGPTWMLLALYQVKSDGSQNALSLIKKAELLGADDMDSQLSKARILELLGRRDEALGTLATCFRKGATRFQIAPTPDLLSLQKDPRYQELLRSDFAPEKRN